MKPGTTLAIIVEGVRYAARVDLRATGDAGIMAHLLQMTRHDTLDDAADACGVQPACPDRSPSRKRPHKWLT